MSEEAASGAVVCAGSFAIALRAWDRATGMRWARLVGELRRRGGSMRVKDSMIGATALRYGLMVATRNVVDFQKARVRVVNPFE